MLERLKKRLVINTRTGIVRRFGFINLTIILVTLLSVFFFLFTQQQNYRESISEIVAQSVNLTFVNSVDRIATYNDFIDSGMRQKLDDVNKDLNKSKGLTVQDIESIRQKHTISSIIVVDSSGAVINSAPPDIDQSELTVNRGLPQTIVSNLVTQGKGSFFTSKINRKDDSTVFKEAYLNIGKVEGYKGDVILIITINIESTNDFNNLFTSPQNLETLNLTRYVRGIEFRDVEDKYSEVKINDSKIVSIENVRSQTYVKSIVEDYTGEEIEVVVTVDFSKTWNRTVFFGVIFLLASFVICFSYYVMSRGLKNDEISTNDERE